MCYSIFFEGGRMQVNVRVGNRIKAAREAVTLSVHELADMVSVAVQHLNEVEAGMTRPSPHLLYEISEKLGTPLSFFFDFEQDLE